MKTDRRKRLIRLLAGAGVLLLALLAYALMPLLTAPDVPVLIEGRDFPVRNVEDEDSGLCPWRDPQGDMTRFFSAHEPGAYAQNANAQSLYSRDETLILTRQRVFISQLLGRTPTGQENAIQLHRIYCKTQSGAQTSDPAGTVITRTIRGESGVIELVLAVNAREQVIGARLQRLREPESVARELQSPRFLNAFRGRIFTSNWSFGLGFAGLAPASRPSAAAILDGARTALILLHVGEKELVARKRPASGHH